MSDRGNGSQRYSAFSNLCELYFKYFSPERTRCKPGKGKRKRGYEATEPRKKVCLSEIDNILIFRKFVIFDFVFFEIKIFSRERKKKAGIDVSDTVPRDPKPEV